MPVALEECCAIGKIPTADWDTEHLCLFLEVVQVEGHKWARFGALGDQVDASLTEGGYKAVFRKEQLVGKILFGKTRKTLADIFKRIGVRNVRHRDLLVESIHDLSKPQEPMSEEQSIDERFALVRNSWTNKPRPEVQLQALKDLCAVANDPVRLQLLKKFNISALLREVLTWNMTDPEVEKMLAERQEEIDRLSESRRNRQLDYVKKKELAMKEHLQAKDWIQQKADFGSLAITAFQLMKNLSQFEVFRRELSGEDFPSLLAAQLDHCRKTETCINLLKMHSKRGTFLPLVASQVTQYQLAVLNTLLNISKDEMGRLPLVEQGVVMAIVKVAQVSSVKDSPRELQCIRILCNLSFSDGKTEHQMVQHGCLVPLVRILREGVGQVRFYAITTISNLAFVQENREEIIDAGVLGLLKDILSCGESSTVLKGVDCIRNLAAAGVDLKFAASLIPLLTELVGSESGTMGNEHRLRAMIALRSISLYDGAIELLQNAGTIELALSIMQKDSLDRLRTQALGLLYNVAGLCLRDYPDLEDDGDDEKVDDDVMMDDGQDPEDAADDEDQQSESSAREEEIEESAEDREASERSDLVKRTRHVLQRRASPIFSMLDDGELHTLALKGDYLELQKGEVLVTEGHEHDFLYGVVRGKMRGTIAIDDAPREVSKLRPGDAACEMCFLEGKQAAATINATMMSTVVLKISPELFYDVLSKRIEREHALGPETRFQSAKTMLQAYWKQKSKSVEVAERMHKLQIEAGVRQIKVGNHLLQVGAIRVLQKMLGEDEEELSLANRVVAESCIALIVGTQRRETALVEMSEDSAKCFQGMLKTVYRNEEWHGHRCNLTTVLSSLWILVFSDKNKKTFTKMGTIPFVLQFLTDGDAKVVQLATAVLLQLSFAMRARWLVRPILKVWSNVTEDLRTGREQLGVEAAITDIVDVAAPTFAVKVNPAVQDSEYFHEVFEAAGEGGMAWLERLIEEEGFDVHMTDKYGANALHYATVCNRFEIMEWLVRKGVSVNSKDLSGCTPLSWQNMLSNVEFSKNVEDWSKSAQTAHTWMVSQGSIAHRLPMFPTTM